MFCWKYFQSFSRKFHVLSKVEKDCWENGFSGIHKNRRSCRSIFSSALDLSGIHTWWKSGNLQKIAKDQIDIKIYIYLNRSGCNYTLSFFVEERSDARGFFTKAVRTCSGHSSHWKIVVIVRHRVRINFVGQKSFNGNWREHFKIK